MKEILKEVERLRKELHQIPEIAQEEEKTAKRIFEELKKCSPDEILTGIGGHGIVATFKSEKEGPHIVFRAELDALPIQEINNFEYRSKTDKRSHKCGHDGHMSILIGLAKYLSQKPIQKGSVSFLFQPAEENGLGAAAMIGSGKLSEIEPIDYMFALHNIPGHDRHAIYSRPGIFTPHVISLEIKLEGKESHAAEPENGINPAMAIARITMGLAELQQLDKSHGDYKLVVPVFTNMGQEWYGISAGYAKLGFTLRTWKTDTMRKLQEDSVRLIEKIGNEYNLQIQTRFFEEFNSIMNDPVCAEQIEQASKNIGAKFIQMKHPMNWGEDYGLFTKKYAGAMFGLGSGHDVPALHNPDYDYPDEITETAIKMYIDILKQNNLY